MKLSRTMKKKKAVTTNFNEKKATCKTQNFFILLAFLLITITLLIAVSIYCYVIKYRVKQKYLLPFHVTNDLKVKNMVSFTTELVILYE